MTVLVDLHLHTTASDGRLSPTELVKLVASQGLEVVSISDHDSTEGLAEAFETAKQFPALRIIPAIELGTDVEGEEIHMLGYFIRYEDEAFQKTLQWLRAGRLERARLIVDKLAGLGIYIEWERVKEIAGDGAVGRPHVALAMVEKGYLKEPKEAFSGYLDINGSAYVDRPKMTPAGAIQIILGVGGVPVLAHPARMSDMETTIAELKKVGLVGMEVYYAQYSTETVEELARLAAKYDLVPCGGSDYHGLGNSEEPLPGSLGPPLRTVELLEEAAQKLS